ncbi:hypothetical protein ASPVEDRAFT_737559 [Aspergillus versicolor CBS 583.65]|uniref:Uncharacterized protein n=1 Tax=Aspergillus versicolor CBS 583.65 TaxID=1036611 RepID=A0A1L9PPT2_ASPVE|nr:uncharacterized protein ASPVEDRAFT_737559 [Aspergillus versicolor CBS 583.65]OJJ03544.1 hypothetical protein ASPVEDRAFT_737559 [Aspergillus versicolor CBS 583.65]
MCRQASHTFAARDKYPIQYLAELCDRQSSHKLSAGTLLIGPGFWGNLQDNVRGLGARGGKACCSAASKSQDLNNRLRLRPLLNPSRCLPECLKLPAVWGRRLQDGPNNILSSVPSKTVDHGNRFHPPGIIRTVPGFCLISKPTMKRLRSRERNAPLSSLITSATSPLTWSRWPPQYGARNAR